MKLYEPVVRPASRVDAQEKSGIIAATYEEISRYSPRRSSFDEHFRIEDYRINALRKKTRRRRLAMVIMIALITTIILSLTLASHGQPSEASCDSVNDGFTCSPHISHFWGQYSPYFSVPSDIPASLPEQCEITFAQILSRHGARDPSASKTQSYRKLVEQVNANATAYQDEFAFIKDYKYQLGADQLTRFGQMEMLNSGIKYYHQYKSLGRKFTPVIRASAQQRVVDSAQFWMQGFHQARLQDSGPAADPTYPYRILTVSEDPNMNNTLNHGQCKAFESGFPSTIAASAKTIWASIFTPSIVTRLNAKMPGTNFTAKDTVYLMDLCPFNSVADENGALSPFCNLFTPDEWQQYDYYQSLKKFYGFSWGNPLGPTQGVGYANELIARLTAKPVDDHTSTNSTLDADPDTFPLGGSNVLYADFSHDNDMISIFSAMGLYNSTPFLSNTTLQDVHETKGYSTSWAVPFAGRAYIEKMRCSGAEEEFVRISVNDRIMPLETCGGDSLGRCRLSKFIDSLSFAQSDGKWAEC